jgi:RimJ/RimL family protein N-acetyltransferase
MIFGRNIRLRAIEQDDLPRFVNWFNDPQVRKGLNIYLPMSQVEEEHWFEELLNRDQAERPFALDIRKGEDWVHVGSCGLFSLDHRSRSSTLGIVIGDKTYWDQGYGSDAVRTLLAHAFETLNLNRVSLRVFESNHRAIEVYKRVGFKLEGRLREDRFSEGHYEDTLIMGILRREWSSEEEGKR